MIKTRKFLGFKHVSNLGDTIDIGAGVGRQTRHAKFEESFMIFYNADKFLNKSRSIPFGERGEKNAYHIVFRG